MTTTMQSRATKRAPMDKMRKTALAAGALYLITFITSIPTLKLYHDVVNNHQYITHAGSNAGLLWGAFLEVILALAGIGTAVTLFPVVKRQNETAALGFVTARVLEGAMILVGVLSLLAVVTLRHDLAGASGADAASLLTTGRALVAIHNWTFLLGQTLMPGINALLLGYVMYRSRLVPRIIPTIGLVGAPILIASVITTMFRINHQITVLAAIGTLPIAAWEFSLGVWLVVKGFKPSPITAANAPSPVRDPEGELVSAIA
jgi:hypothetical protein